MANIRDTLLQIGAIDRTNLVEYSSRTRDRDVPVSRDSVSGVIFIDEFYVGEKEYEAGEYRPDDGINFEDSIDTERRFQQFQPLIHGRRIVDFGCGAGSFLRRVSPEASFAVGVELQQSFRQSLARDGIAVFQDLAEIDLPVDTLFMFHVLEHLPDPLQSLSQARATLKDSGFLVVEVPHARDFLLQDLDCVAFRDFTLWSQHLVLHTRDSLRRLLLAAGFTKVAIQGVQRYGPANHLQWLSTGKPGGHRGPLLQMQTEELRDAYAAALAGIDATDTLVAVARSG